ncbi:GTPase Era [Solitalea canadensis]|uniref:GTPase Era n=1 Tax=Solitalea canadensis (strain ATCC 29591 / DSM 3403 / JCM 21819 / LMG 8368 / NBRC 15130 / NCIMB 12057 / USAM 9D) TaxID=929556 RepID=H8KWM1_SOLCM|nr:GTPase Era [Solitalea canadensis]AFD08200.1 GTP-binding protein Era [Solitalea canadensis DSM 3403]
MEHKAGFVSIVGKPNAGKSTLMNILVGERMSIITHKAQTTRHRIIGIINDEDTQIIFSDTPGMIQPKYGLQKSMMSAVNESFLDADVLLVVTDINEKHDEADLIEKVKKYEGPVAVLINKVDQSNQELVTAKFEYWQKELNPAAIIPISALKEFNIDAITSFIRANLPVHPPYYDKEELTDRSERFFVSEIIREQIFKCCEKEVPYSSEVVIVSFKEGEDIDRISAEIIVERETQKAIIIGKGGLMLKKIASAARYDIELFLQKKVFLEVFVKVLDDWRNKDNYLKRFGYES